MRQTATDSVSAIAARAATLPSINDLHLAVPDHTGTENMPALFVHHANHRVAASAFGGHHVARDLDIADAHVGAHDVTRLHERFRHDIDARHDRVLLDVP